MHFFSLCKCYSGISTRLGDNFLWVSDISACLRNRGAVWYCWKHFENGLKRRQGLKTESQEPKTSMLAVQYKGFRAPQVQHCFLETQTLHV